MLTLYALWGDQNVKMIAYRCDIEMAFDQYECEYDEWVHRSVKSVDHNFPLDKRKGVHAQVSYWVDLDTCEASLEPTLMALPIVDKPARESHVPYLLLDYIQPIEPHIVTQTCDSSH